jgi:hypothetical protein
LLALVLVILGIVGGIASGGIFTSTNRPLPHSRERDSGHVPTSPERLADARRSGQ